MSGGAHNHSEVPVKAGETVAAVVAALAVEQIAQGALERLTVDAAKASLDVVGVLLRLVLPIMLVVTTVRFVHGNVMHLATQYRRWHHLEVPRDSLVAIPIGHFIDVVFHLLEYLCLVAAGYFFAKDLRLVAISVGALLALDAIWLGVFAALNRGASEPTKKTHKNWLVWDVIALLAVIFIVATWFIRPVWSVQLEVVLTVVLVVATVADYGANYEHFFNQRLAQESIELGQASAVVQYVSTLISLTQLPKGSSPTTREFLADLLEVHFAYFMADKSNREKMFRRAAEAKLHVGIYIEQDGDLIPVFRYVEQGVDVTNKTIRVGAGYVGRAYSLLRDDPTGVHFYARPDPQWSLPGQGGDRANVRYKSAMVTGVYWGSPTSKDRQAVGAMLVTANTEDYFTRSVHESMLLAVSRVLTLSLYRHVDARDPKEVRKRLLELCSPPIVVNVQKQKKGRSSS